MTETELFSSSAYVEWDAYIVPGSVSLLVIGYCKCGRCRKFTRSDIAYGFIFFDDQSSTHRIINNRVGCIGDSDLLRCWCHTTKLCCATCCRSFGAPDFNGDGTCFICGCGSICEPRTVISKNLRMWLAWLILFVLFYWGYPHSL